MAESKRILFPLFFLSSLLITSVFSQSLDEGKHLLNEGEYQKGLNLIYSLIREGKTDQETAFLYVEYVAGLEIDSLYEKAEEVYFLSLDQNSINFDSKAVKEELMRLKPILKKKKFRAWNRYLKRNDKRLIPEVKKYWAINNPIITSEYNERLIEHWNRVYIAKRDYQINNKSGFGSDDRGSLYVKLGKPDEVKKRSVSLSSYTDPSTGNIIPIQNNIHFSIEIWYYGNIEYVFGIPGSGGVFGLQSGILELIPEAGNRPTFFFDPTENMVQLTNQNSSANSGGSVNNPLSQQGNTLGLAGTKQLSRKAASLLLQYSVLEQVGDIDPFYLDLFNRMNRDLIRNTLNGTSNSFNSIALTHNLKYKAIEQNWFMDKTLKTPLIDSETMPVSKFFKLSTYFYEFLNEKFSPIWLMVTELYDHDDLALYLSQERDSSTVKNIIRTDYFITYDSLGNKISQEDYSIPLASKDYSSMNSFMINSSDKDIIFQSSFVDTSSIENKIITSSEAVLITRHSSLVSKKNNEIFSISDLILAEEQEESLNTRIPFFPNLSREFKSGDDLIVYFEVYGIPKREVFSLEYGRERSNDKVKIKFNSDSVHNGIWFKIKLSPENYSKGNQTIEFRFLYKGKEIRRDANITIR